MEIKISEPVLLGFSWEAGAWGQLMSTFPSSDTQGVEDIQTDSHFHKE